MKTVATYRYVTIEKLPRDPDRRTDKFEVRALSGETLATIGWWNAWRRYCLYPHALTVWSAGCLADIQDFIGKLEEEALNSPCCLTMSAPMILAYQEGRKRQTRRVVMPQPEEITVRNISQGCTEVFWKDAKRLFYSGGGGDVLRYAVNKLNPYGRPGDELLLREPYEVTVFDPDDPAGTHLVSGYYLADGKPFLDISLAAPEWEKLCARKHPLRAQPGRFMYRSLCRHRVGIREVRVERLQEITREDAIAEGLQSFNGGHYWGVGPADAWERNPRRTFKRLWDSINAKRGWGWDANPWVWVLEFEPMEEE